MKKVTVASLVADAINAKLPPALENKAADGLDTRCAVTGDHITRGVRWRDVIPSTTGEYLDLLHGGTAYEYMSIDAARAFKASKNLGSRLIFEDRTAYHPFIACSSADKDEYRTCWSRLVREVYPSRVGQKCVCIITDNFKKKVWYRAHLGELGKSTPVFLFDSRRMAMENVLIDWGRLIEVLDYVESLYNAGFSKDTIEATLFRDYKHLANDPLFAAEAEEKLENMRGTPEFRVSLLIAQKSKS